IASNGNSILDRILGSDDVARTLEALARADVSRARAGARHVLAVPAVRALAVEARLVEIAARYLGDNVAPFRATLLEKSLDRNWLVSWHQDTALPITGNGPLRVLPGSHTHGVLDHDEIRNLAATTEAIACIAPAGSVVAMRPLIVHSSSKAQSSGARRVLHIEYAAERSFDGGIQLAG